LQFTKVLILLCWTIGSDVYQIQILRFYVLILLCWTIGYDETLRL